MMIAVTMRDPLLGSFNWIKQIQDEGVPEGSEGGVKRPLLGKRRRRKIRKENT